MSDNLVDYAHFAQLDLRFATIVAVEPIEGADKLWKLTLDVGAEAEGGLGERTVATGIKPWYSAEELLGRQVVYLANLAPRRLRGVLSEGMILAAGEDEPVLLAPAQRAPNGARIR